MPQRHRTLRDHIFREFLLLSAVLVALAALVTTAANKFTEDRVLREIIETLANPLSDDTPILRGPLEAMPSPLRAELRTLSGGVHELTSTDREAQALVDETKTPAQYTVLMLNRDPSTLDFLFWLAIGSALGLIFAYRLSRTLSARLSQPIERLINLNEQTRSIDETTRPQHAVHELATLESRLLDARRQAERISAREASFARLVSHELRTPLTVLEGVHELLHQDCDTSDESLQRRIARMGRAVKTMQATTESLMAFAHAERQLLNADATFVDALATIMNQYEDVAAPGVSLSTEIIGYPQARVEWVSLAVALQPLIANAVASTQYGSVQVRITSQSARVSDTGTGIEPRLLKRIIEREPLDGHLGIALVHRVCDLNDWHIGFKSTARGTTVVLDFGSADGIQRDRSQ
ncbi:MAG: HAMP domain-containing sensor histidine kinase [Pseudomonadota bacterium]